MKRMLFFLAWCGATLFDGYAQTIPAVTADQLMARAANKDTTYIINFWATWCGPCIAELPEFSELNEFYADQKVKVILVSLDFPDAYPDKLGAYIVKKALKPEVVWFRESNANLFIPKIDNRWTGSLPGTMIVQKRSDFKHFLERKITAAEIKDIIAGLKN